MIDIWEFNSTCRSTPADHFHISIQIPHFVVAMLVVGDFSQMSPDEITVMFRELQSQLDEARKSSDDLRCQLDEMSKSKPKSKPSHDPNDPEDPDDEGDDEDPDDPKLPTDDIPDNSFKVFIRFNDDEHLFKMDSGEQPSQSWSLRWWVGWTSLGIKWNWHLLELTSHWMMTLSLKTPFTTLKGHWRMMWMRTPLTLLLVSMLDLTWGLMRTSPRGSTFNLVNVIEQFGERRTFPLSLSIEGIDHAMGCITCFLMEKTRTPVWCIRLVIRNPNVVDFFILGRGGTLKKRRCSIAELKAKTNDPVMVKECFKIEGFREEAWLDSLSIIELGDYYKSFKDLKGFPHQVQCTVDNIKEMKTLKVAWNILTYQLFYFPAQLSHFPT